MTDLDPMPPARSAFEGGSWRLERGIPIPIGVTVTARFVGGTLSGSIGGARYRAQYDWEPRSGRLRIAAARPADDANPLERDYLRLLTAVASARLEPTGGLVLSDALSDALLWFAPVATVGPDLAGRWSVVEVVHGDDPASRSGAPAHLTFESDGLVTGSVGVNRVRGQARTDGDALYLGPLATTRMTGEPEAMDAETAMLAALDRVARFRVDDARLTLLDGDGAPLVHLRRAPGPPPA